MTDKSFMENKKTFQLENALRIGAAITIVILLALRDCFGISISKYLFLLIVFFVVMLMSIQQSLALFCFLIPLYVGLPGNFITIIYLLKFLLEIKKIRLQRSQFLLVFAISLFVIIQNYFMGKVSVYNMIFVAEIIFILFIFAYQESLHLDTLFFMFSAGVTVMGLIMLFAVLKEFSFIDILSSTARLGTSATDYETTETMKVSVDPNYYGLFTITSLSISYPILLKRSINFKRKILLITILSLSLAVCLIGLSRAFVLVSLLWIFLVILAQKKFKNFVKTILVFILTVITIQLLLPDAINALLARFQQVDMITGNGRLDLISQYYVIWGQNPITILFGIGLFNCRVHCMPLQYLFGGGVVLGLLMASFAISLVNSIRRTQSRIYLKSYIPMLVVFVLSLTLPIAVSMTFMFPCILTILASKYENGVSDEAL